ncbi:MAG: ion channel [Pseudomonadota bacterium]
MQFLISLSVIAATAYIHGFFLSLLMDYAEGLKSWVEQSPGTFRYTSVLAVSMIWVMIAHLTEVFVWASVLFVIGIFEAYESSVYFSLVAYTTLGFGDIILEENWRLLSGFIAANGFLVFGWSTAFQVEFFSRIHIEGESS